MVGKSVLNLVSVYAPQAGRSMEEKEEFYVSLLKTVSSIDARERLVVCGDFNGHVGAEVDGFEGIHGGHGFGSRNTEGEMLLEFADAVDLAVGNTWFTKDEAKLVTYESGGCRTVVDYILVRKNERSLLSNITVLQGEPSLQQHKLLVGMLELKEHVKSKREVFVSRCKVWRLKEAEMREAFRARVEERLAMRVDGNVDATWSGLRDCLMEVADEVCGRTKGNQRHSETWWWNSEVGKVIKEKRRLYKIYEKSKKESDKIKMNENKSRYNQAKCMAKREVSKAQEIERKKFGEMLDEKDKKGM
jgi:hypothetical protein